MGDVEDSEGIDDAHKGLATGAGTRHKVMQSNLFCSVYV